MTAYPKTFEDLLDDVLEPDSRIYASPWVGDDKMHSLIYHENTSEVTFSQREMAGLEIYFETNDLVNIVPHQVKNYALELSLTRNPVDYEFVAPPGSRATPRAGRAEVTKDAINTIAEDWAIISNSMVDPEGSTYYLDKLWKDDQASPKAADLSLEEIHITEENALQKYFDKTDVLEGEDYSLVYGSR